MIRAVCPDAVSDLKTGFVTGWNVSPNIAYTITVVPGASSCAVWLFDAATGAYLAGGAALTGTDQPVTLLPATSPGVGMVDTDLGYHLLVTTDGTEDAQTYGIGPFVDGQDQLSAIYTVDNLAVVQATAVIREGTHYTDDASIMCPLGFDGLLGDIVSATVHGASIVGDIESVSFQAGPSSMADVVTVRRMSAILPDAPVVIVPPVVTDDAAETDAVTATSGNVLTNDASGLTIVAVDGLESNVGIAVAGAAGGVFTIAANGAWTFDPDGDFATLSGSDTATTSVTYHASNGQAEAMATMTVTVSSGAAVAWTPAEIATELWLDAADNGTITLNGANVSQWADKSGNGRHVAQGTAAYQPALSGTDIVFSGDYLASATLSLDLNGYGIAAVYTASETGSTYAGFINLRSANFEDPDLRIGISNYIRCYADGTYKINVNAFVTTRNISVICFSPAETALYKNGTLVVSSAVSSLSSVVSLKIGHYDAANTSFSGTRNGTANEIVIYPQSLDTQQKVEGYLAHKWDAILGQTTLVDALPASHPYKAAPPTV